MAQEVSHPAHSAQRSENKEVEMSTDSIAPPDTATSEQHESSETTKPSAPRSGMCAVCNTNPGKYKCPRCRMPYCSVACNKAHKDNHPPDPEPVAAPSTDPMPKNSEKPKFDPSNPFGILESSEKLQMLFKKYPHLPDQLLKIHAATEPPAQSGPTFLGGKPTESRRLEKEIWSRATGIKKGKEALQRAREASGEEGEAVREYQELVLHLLSGRDDSTQDVVQRRLANQENELLKSFVVAETSRSKD
ncbi:hypothetical protein jhhlp_004375 [Lomentospora prolificans]|uniref:HIT-type domain-containing protein n=1 Tax=Lomentospora prolificans TaxID=41688 RepID=A0A2N3NBD9_9PEZI|nr:hypothetical protein jhhlp_004375 [Lomentospora prolificans]